jgi:hypothetical protein
MARKKNNTTILYIGAAAVLLYFLMKKKKESGQKRFMPEMSEKGDNLKSEMKVFVNREDYFKDQYKESLNACSY